MASKPSRKHRAAQSKQPKRIVKKPAKQTASVANETPTVSRKLSSVFGLTRQAVRTPWSRKKQFAGIAAIYGLLNIIFVSGLGSGIDVTTIRDSFSSRIVGGIAAYVQLLGGSGNTASEVAGVYQMMLFLVASLALVWALRQTHAENAFRIRDAYYKGMHPLVPSIVVVCVMGLQLLPAVIGATVYQTIMVSGIAATGAQSIIWLIALLAAFLLSLYFLVSSLQAFYVATLPDMTPWVALRAARKLVKSRRWTVLRKVLFLPLLLILITAVLMLPVIIALPALAQLWLLIIAPVLIVFSHSYLYGLYKELLP